MIKLLLFIILFTFNMDAPESLVWREAYKKCLITCTQEIDNKHWCNMHCVRIADKIFYEYEKQIIKENNLMKVICDCGKEMLLNLYEPDQGEVYLELYCNSCGATFSGKLKPSKLIKNDAPETLGSILRDVMNKL